MASNRDRRFVNRALDMAMAGGHSTTVNTLWDLLRLITTLKTEMLATDGCRQRRRQDFVTGGGEVRYGSIGGLEYEVPQSRRCIVCVSTWLFARRPCNVFVV